MLWKTLKMTQRNREIFYVHGLEKLRLLKCSYYTKWCMDSMSYQWKSQGFPGDSVVKNLPASAGDVGSIPGWEDDLEKEMAIYSRILAWKIPRTEAPSGL